jgi:hypothetical protein
MQIHLIADVQNADLTDALVSYLQPLLAHRVTFQIHPYEGEERTFWTWKELFDIGTQVKNKQLLGREAQCFVFLCHGYNEHNWFGSISEEDSNIAFLHTFGWENLGFQNSLYPVAYHLMSLLTGMKFFGSYQMADVYHGISRGCMFDFTGNKSEVRFKLQSANICPECLGKIASNAEDKAEAMDYVQRLLSVFRSVKDHLFAVDLHQYFGNLEYKLVLSHGASILLKIDNRSIELPLSKGKEKALFLMLLRHEKGLTYKDFEKDPILREFLTIYFRHFVNQGTFESIYRQAKQQIEDGSFRKQLEPVISRMRKKLQQSLAAYPKIMEALTIQSRQGALVIPVQRLRVENLLDKSILKAG